MTLLEKLEEERDKARRENEMLRGQLFDARMQISKLQSQLVAMDVELQRMEPEDVRRRERERAVVILESLIEENDEANRGNERDDPAWPDFDLWIEERARTAEGWRSLSGWIAHVARRSPKR